MDPAAGDDQRLRGLTQHRGGPTELALVRSRPGDLMDHRLEDAGRVVVGLGRTSWGRPMKAGPHVAGSSIVATAWGSVWTTCAGVTMRSRSG